MGVSIPPTFPAFTHPCFGNTEPGIEMINIDPIRTYRASKSSWDSDMVRLVLWTMQQEGPKRGVVEGK